MGHLEKDILEQCCRERRPLPKRIREAPELNLGLEFVYSAFWQLSTCRNSGWGPGPIPWRDIADYVMFHRLSELDREDFVYLIRAMDSAFLGHHAKKAAESAAKTAAETPAPA